MTAKPQKTAAELKALLMAEIRKHPKLAHIRDVAITRPVQTNWGVQWIPEGNSPTPLAEADQIGRNLQNQYDLKLPS
jgi:hypothetical protein